MHPDHLVRVVALLANGKEIVGIMNPEISNGHVQQVTQCFGGLSIKDIKAFRLESRPFEWAEFKNIALQPSSAGTGTR